MDEAQVRDSFAKRYAHRPHNRPAFWEDERYNGSNQPVVGVNWYEASAYCSWLAAQIDCLSVSKTRVSVRLPTEAEWERVARLERRWVYPWGNRWSIEKANTREGHVLRPRPVGAHPGGVTPARLHDLSGNVREWTASLYRPYPYRDNDGRNDPKVEGYRVLRGGSWIGNQANARCASRLRSAPVDHNVNFGFRAVVSVSDSVF